jgi:hypothetical protein
MVGKELRAYSQNGKLITFKTSHRGMKLFYQRFVSIAYYEHFHLSLLFTISSY